MTNVEWQQKYTEALLELRPEELPRRIRAALMAIEQRAQALEQRGESSAEEHLAIQDAKRKLRVLAECQNQCGAPNSGTVPTTVTP